MKKLLLVLFTSFTFLSSVNADSIDGAFGYKFGQVVDDVTISQHSDGGADARKNFKPNKPLLGLNEYWVMTTLKDKMVYEIAASVYLKPKKYDMCSSNSSDYSKILKALKVKYGNSLELRNDKNICRDSFCYTYREDYFDNYSQNQLNLSDISIEFKCNWYVDSGEYPSANRYYMYLTYTDRNLKSKWYSEDQELIKKKLQGQLQDVDF